jgi:hypothetical protein
VLVKRLLGHGSEDTGASVRKVSSPQSSAPTTERCPNVGYERTGDLVSQITTVRFCANVGSLSPDQLGSDHAVEDRVEGDLDDITIQIDDLYRRAIWLIGPLVLEQDNGFAMTNVVRQAFDRSIE